MNIDPLSTALLEINETKQILESLLVASERFDYPKAKVAIRSLHRKARDLGKLKTRFQQLESLRAPNVQVINFRATRILES